LISDPNEERLKKLMVIGQLRTWPKISIISNRMRIEASIEKVRKALRDSAKASRGRVDSYSESEHQKQAQYPETVDTTNAHAANNSDAGSGDELIFLSRRRRSMPDGSFQTLQDKDFYKEQNKRRRFMAQFAGSSKSNTQSSLLSDSDSDSHPCSPGSPEI
jgi:hypothetical protein